MFFRLNNTPTTFQGYINKILAKKLNIFIIVYLNNIFIYNKSEKKKHIETLILNHLKLEHHIRIKIDVSGHTISGILSKLTLDDLGQ